MLELDPLRAFRFTAVAALLVIAAGVLMTEGTEVSHSQEPATSLGIDADPTGNSADSLGPRDECISVNQGDTFDVDVTIEDVSELLAWEAFLTYEPDIIEVLERDAELFQAADGASTIFDLSQSTPDSDGRYGMGAVDTADPVAPDSGSGVLARLTLRAKGTGTSSLALPQIDLNEDTVPDRGPTLKNVAGDVIGDEDEDGIFDGSVSDAEVVVGSPCQAGDGDGFPWLIVGLVLAGVAVVVAGGGVLAYRASQGGRPGGA
jgi:hypothetical protein